MLSNFKKPENEPLKPTTPQSTAPAASAAPAVSTAPRASDRSPPSIIGSDLVISGNLASKGQIQIDGEVQGDTAATHVIVGESARITGGITADEVVVRGRVQGSVRGKRVMLQANSHVEGDIFHKALAIEQGAFFEGKSRRSDDPLAGGPQQSETPPMAANTTPAE